MSDEVLDVYNRQYIEGQDGRGVSFAWQGGEPTLMGAKFFRRVVELQQHYTNGKIIQNASQTNGTLLDEEWGESLAANRFLVGLSVDGRASLHDTYRVDKKQTPAFERAMRGLDLLKKTRRGVQHAHNSQPQEFQEASRGLPIPEGNWLELYAVHPPR